MKKLLILLAFVPFLVNGQIPPALVDLSEYHDDSRIKEMTDLNFTNITEGGYTLPLIKVDSVVFTNGASIANWEADTLFITETVTKIEGEFYVTGHVYEGEHAAGGAWVSTPGTQTINTGGTFEKIDEGAIAYTAMHLHEFTHADGRLTYTSATTLSMTINVVISVESGETAQEVHFRIAKGGTTIAGSDMAVNFTAVNAHTPVALLWPVDMAQNEYIEVFVTSDTNADEVIIDNLVLFIAKH